MPIRIAAAVRHRLCTSTLGELLNMRAGHLGTYVLVVVVTCCVSLLGCKSACRRGTTLKDGLCVASSENPQSVDAGRDEDARTANETARMDASASRTPESSGSGGSVAAQAGEGAQTERSEQAGAGAGAASPKSDEAGQGGSTSSSMMDETPSAGAAPDAGVPVDSGSADMSLPCVPTQEACDNEDNDCDGAVDEGVTKPCGTDVGTCDLGVLACKAGQWDDEETQCQGGIGPSPEVCDAAREDEDCDGMRNEGCDCVEGETTSCGNETAPCKPGVITCSDGAWPTQPSACRGAVGPSTESCDGVDNDCNGVTDDRAACSEPGTSCRQGRCVECTSNSECGRLTEGCHVGVCNSRGRCESEDVSGSGTSCNLPSGTGVCENGQCRECVTSTDCRGRAGRPVCSGNVCVTCTETEGCGGDQRCRDGQCIARCGDGVVDRDEQCDTGPGSGWDFSNCTIDCKRRVYADCTEGESCTDGQKCGTSLNICTNLFCTGNDSCTRIPGFAVACTPNSMCEILCNNGTCPNGLRCSSTANGVTSCVR